MNLQQLGEQAVGFHQKGQVAEAERLYQQILAAAPRDFTANYMLGVIRFQQARSDDALALFENSLKTNPAAIGPLIYRGLLLQALGRPAEALACFDKTLAVDPNLAEALVNRGNALCDLTRFAEALTSYDKAVVLAPKMELAWYNRGIALRGLQRFPDSLASFDRALALRPNYTDALNNRGSTLREMNQPEPALACFDKLLSLEPANASALYNRGTALQDLQRFVEALDAFDRALAIQPRLAAAWHNRGIVLQALKSHDQALASLDNALALEPDNAKNLNNRGNLLRVMDRLEDALISFDRALAIQPRSADAHINRADTLRDLGRLSDALDNYGRALAIAPNNIAALNNRGSVLQTMKRFDEALKDYDRAVRIDLNFIEALYNRGHLLWNHYRRFDSALQDLEHAGRIRPDYDYLQGDLLHLRMQLADWRALDQQIATINDGVRAGKIVVRPFIYQPISQSPADLEAASRLYAAHRFPPVPPPPVKSRNHAKIRLGYMSGDFREQATAFLAAGLYELHDRNKFEIVAFDTGWSDNSALRRRLEAGFDKFIDISSLTDRHAADRIAAEEIDILVNLNGYFGTERMGIFARRPAPIQVNYLGFPATLGAPYIDYILADQVVIPENEQQFYTEKTVTLPDGYQVNDAKRSIAEATPTRDACGLPPQAFVFCNFNHIYKLTPEMFRVWMKILRQVEGSVLWLLESNPRFPQNLRQEAERHGVAAERLVFAPPTTPDRHLARIKLADLFLDSLPYNAHTTASDSLWAGLPLLTCRGKTFPGRVAASLLYAVGMPELVTEYPDDYQALALALARDPARLAALRQKLARNRLTAPLFDTDRFRRNLESAYTTMWEIYRKGESPRAFAVAPVA